MLLLVGRALTYGRGVALATAAGNTIGTCLVAVLVALGIGPLLERSELLFHLVRLVGAGYLIWLGITAVRYARKNSVAAAGDARPHPFEPLISDSKEDDRFTRRISSGSAGGPSSGPDLEPRRSPLTSPSVTQKAMPDLDRAPVIDLCTVRRTRRSGTDQFHPD